MRLAVAEVDALLADYARRNGGRFIRFGSTATRRAMLFWTRRFATRGRPTAAFLPRCLHTYDSVDEERAEIAVTAAAVFIAEIEPAIDRFRAAIDPD